MSMEFCPASGSCVTNMYNANSGTANSLSVTQIVTHVKFCCDEQWWGGKTLNYMVFTLLDGSTI